MKPHSTKTIMAGKMHKAVQIVQTIACLIFALACFLSLSYCGFQENNNRQQLKIKCMDAKMRWDDVRGGCGP